ncbi:MAG: ABC transporter permease [Betaproteobacteria bacterium]
MNTMSNAMPEPSGDAHVVPSAAAARTRPFFWSVRRELWENRSIYIAPLAVAAVIVFGFLISMVKLVDRMRDVLALDPQKQSAAIAMPYDIAAIIVIVTSLIVAASYCLGALHGERRDRSILFWKSLPVSDLTTVLSKAFIPLVVLPLIAFATVEVMQLIMRLLNTAVLLANGMSPALLWTFGAPFEGSLVLLYGLAVTALWYAPVYGWLLLVSGWARRATFLWALLPPLALCVAEAIAFHTWRFAAMLKYRLSGGFAEAFVVRGHSEGYPKVGLEQLDPVKFLTTPGLWIGLGFAAAFLAAAVWLRRNREPI